MVHAWVATPECGNRVIIAPLDKGLQMELVRIRYRLNRYLSLRNYILVSASRQQIYLLCNSQYFDYTIDSSNEPPLSIESNFPRDCYRLGLPLCSANNPDGYGWMNHALLEEIISAFLGVNFPFIVSTPESFVVLFTSIVWWNDRSDWILNRLLAFFILYHKSTYLGRDKMAPVLQTTFPIYCLVW